MRFLPCRGPEIRQRAEALHTGAIRFVGAQRSGLRRGPLELVLRSWIDAIPVVIEGRVCGGVRKTEYDAIRGVDAEEQVIPRMRVRENVARQSFRDHRVVI